MVIDKIKYPSILGHLNVFCPLAPSLSRVALIFTPAAFICCWSRTLSLLWGIWVLLSERMGPKFTTLRRKSQQQCNGCFKNFSFNILFTKDIKTQVLIHFGYITKLNFLIEVFKNNFFKK
jgi:hypothetical protein